MFYNWLKEFAENPKVHFYGGVVIASIYFIMIFYFLLFSGCSVIEGKDYKTLYNESLQVIQKQETIILEQTEKEKILRNSIDSLFNYSNIKLNQKDSLINFQNYIIETKNAYVDTMLISINGAVIKYVDSLKHKYGEI